MIYFALSHKDGAETVSSKYGLRYVSPKEYVKEGKLCALVPMLDHDKLLNAIQDHEDIHAYVLSGTSIYFHPDPVMKAVTTVYKDYFATLV